MRVGSVFSAGCEPERRSIQRRALIETSAKTIRRLQSHKRQSLVHLPTNWGTVISCGQFCVVFALGHDFCHRFPGPIEWMSMLVPFLDKRVQALGQVGFVREVC